MSSARTILRFNLRPSWRLAFLISGLHVLAAGSILAVSASAPGAALAILLVALGGVTARDRALLRGRRSPQAIEACSDGSLQVVLGDGTFARAAEAPRTVSRLLVALPLRHHSRRSVLVTADMLDPDGFRRLRLWALWGRLPGVAPAQLPG